MPAASRAETVESLRSRIRAMQATGLGARTLPTSPAVGPLLPGGALKAGAAYSVGGSLALAMLLLAGPSAAGGWCGVVGMPEFGIEAAAGLGIDLTRLVLVPEPGEHWLTVTAQLAEVLPAVLVRPHAGSASPAEVARLASRLRQHGGVLVVAAPWPGAEATLDAESGGWIGIGGGSGILAGRELDVLVTARQIRSRHRVALGAASPSPVPLARAATG